MSSTGSRSSVEGTFPNALVTEELSALPAAALGWGTWAGRAAVPGKALAAVQPSCVAWPSPPWPPALSAGEGPFGISPESRSPGCKQSLWKVDSQLKVK